MNSIRPYNTSLAFTSMGVNKDEKYANNHTGTYTYRTHGTIYHRIGSPFPHENPQPKFAQLYIYMIPIKN